MSAQTVAFLSALAQAQLLTARQLADIRGWAEGAKSDPNETARELIRRGWLTAHQVREIAKGNIKELTVGPYLVLDVLGEGGMGRVYRARHTRLGRDVALKVIRKEKLSNPQTVGRFQQEIHAAAQVSHPNVVLAFDAESADGNLFLSMEYVEGTDLTKLVAQNGPMPVAHACDAVRQAALGLQHAHERGLVHRDIKPSNLLYTPKGQVKILDLGLAQLTHDLPGGDAAGRVTQVGFVLGTPEFLAPEQAQNPGGVDIRADIYALGATLFFLLTARVPYEGQTPTEMLLKHIQDPPPSLLAVRPDAPPQLDALIRWMMAKKPEGRPDTPARVAAALLPFALPQSGVMARPSGMPSDAVVVLPAAVPDDEPNLFADLGDDPPGRRSRVNPVVAKTARSSLPLLLIGAGVALTVLAVAAAVVVSLIDRNKPASPPPPPEDSFANTVNMQMVKLDGGTFTMGSPDDEKGRDADEGPQRPVTLSGPFYLAATEVTRGQYTAVMNKPPRVTPNLSDKFLDRVPASGVTWDDAAEFCRKLNEKEPNRRAGWEYRLPTEAEWEYAARAGTDTPFAGRAEVVQYTHGVFKLVPGDPYGRPNDNPKLVRYDFENRPATVGSKEGNPDHVYRRTPNPWGLYDMTGNVWEWCRDQYADYPPGPATDPAGPSDGVWRVQRGGAYDCPAADCRAARRRGTDPTTVDPSVGFRVAFAPKR